MYDFDDDDDGWDTEEEPEENDDDFWNLAGEVNNGWFTSLDSYGNS